MERCFEARAAHRDGLPHRHEPQHGRHDRSEREGRQPAADEGNDAQERDADQVRELEPVADGMLEQGRARHVREPRDSCVIASTRALVMAGGR